MTLPPLFHSVLKGLDVTYALVDSQGYIIEHSPEFLQWVSDESETVMGYELVDIWPELFGQEAELAAVRQGNQPLFCLENLNRVTSDGEIHYLRLIAVPGIQPHLIVLTVDMTELSLQMQDLTQTRNELQLLQRQLSHANQHLQNLNQQHLTELATARRIQQGLLQPAKPEWSDLGVVCYNDSRYEIGGDFYKYHKFKKSPTNDITPYYTFAVGDVSGKGVSAALLMAACLSQFDASLLQHLTPRERMIYLDQAIEPYTRPGRQNCAICYVELIPLPKTTPPTYELITINAGCIPPYIKRTNGQVEHHEIGGFALGQGLAHLTGYQQLDLTLTAGDVIILTSDGIVEATNDAGKMLGFDRLEQIIQAGPTTSAQAMFDYLKQAVFAFTGQATQYDDMTAVIIRV